MVVKLHIGLVSQINGLPQILFNKPKEEQFPPLCFSIRESCLLLRGSRSGDQGNHLPRVLPSHQEAKAGVACYYWHCRRNEAKQRLK